MPNYLARHNDPFEGRDAMRYRNDSYILRHKIGSLFECGKRCVAHFSGQKCFHVQSTRNIDVLVKS
jgi:hypothetical protein